MAGPSRFTCLRVDEGRAVHVVVVGELDLATAPQLDDALRRAEAGARLIVLDLRRLEFMDCSGLRVALAADRRVREAGGRLVVVRGPVAVTRLLALTGADHQLELADRPPMWAAAALATREAVPA